MENMLGLEESALKFDRMQLILAHKRYNILPDCYYLFYIYIYVVVV